MKWIPIKIGPYRLDNAELKILRKPTLEQAAEAGQFLEGFENRTPWFRGEWYVHIRATFPETL